MKLNIDLQTHTNRSPECGWTSPSRLIGQAVAVGLDGLAVTDHNTMEAVERAKWVAEDGFLVIPAMEIDTTEGQIIGLFLSDPIDPWQSPGATIDAIHRQGGIALTPHPFDSLREGLATIHDHADELDAIETINSRCLLDQYNQRAAEFAAEHDLPATGGSDAHFATEVGQAHTVVDVESDIHRYDEKLEAVKTAIRDGRIRPVGSTGTNLVHAGTKIVKLYNRFR